MNKNILALIILVVTAAPAWAEEASQPYKEYSGVSFGSAKFSNTSPSSHPNVYSVTLGHRFNPMLAVEANLPWFGDFTVSNGVSAASVSAWSANIAAVGTLPVSQDFNFLGKIGFGYNRAHGSTTLPGRSGADITHNDVFFGLGAQYHVNSRISLLASYENYGKFENTASPMKATSVSFGVIFHHN